VIILIGKAIYVVFRNLPLLRRHLAGTDTQQGVNAAKLKKCGGKQCAAYQQQNQPNNSADGSCEI
jgi:hypothetical protein